MEAEPLSVSPSVRAGPPGQDSAGTRGPSPPPAGGPGPRPAAGPGSPRRARPPRTPPTRSSDLKHRTASQFVGFLGSDHLGLCWNLR